MVLFDKATYDKLLCEAPTYKLITPSILSDLEDKADAISHMDTIVHSTKGNPSVAQIFEGREPEQFFSITQKLIILKGGMSIRYKRCTAEKGRRKFTHAESSSTSSISFIQDTPNETLQIGRLISGQSWTFQEIWLPNSTGQS